jgi:hypothetical protein
VLRSREEIPARILQPDLYGLPILIEQEQKGWAFGLAAHGVDTGWDFGRRSYTGLLVHPLEERLRISFLRPGAEVVGYALAEDVARYGRSACVEILCVGGQRFCAFKVDEVGP